MLCRVMFYGTIVRHQTGDSEVMEVVHILCHCREQVQYSFVDHQVQEANGLVVFNHVILTCVGFMAISPYTVNWMHVSSHPGQLNLVISANGTK